jgi:hypothetical protein
MTDPITVARFAEELEKLKGEMDAGNLEHGEYDQRLSRMIHELRERGIDADRPALATVLGKLLGKGTITPGVKNHLEKRLGLS